MEKHKLQSLVKRVISALVMIPVVVGALFLGEPWSNFLFLLIGAFLAWEWASMVPSLKKEAYAVAYTLVATVSAFFEPGLVWALLVVTTFLIIFFVSRKENEKFLLRLGVLYISLGVASLSWLNMMFGFLGIMWFFLMVWSVDVGGYVFGTTIKGPKLAPRISPNKTWAGLIGGMLLSAAMSALYIWYFNALNLWTFFCPLAAAIALVAQIGDLVESAIKRHLGLKDSSNLIPGHGGVFDRVDGLIFAAPIFFVCWQVFYMLSE